MFLRRRFRCALIFRHDSSRVIELANVSKVFQGKRKVTALEHVDLSIGGGEMVSIVGPSGSGKSTLLNLIGGLDTASSGEIEIDGRRLSGLSDDELTRLRRDKIGFIFQFFNLLPTLTCQENVSIPLHLRGWPKKKIEERANELLQLVGLTARKDHLPDELSGGERQRCAIARALSVNGSCAAALFAAAHVHAYIGDAAKAEDYAHQALRLSPFDPLSHQAYVALGAVRIRQQRYYEAAEFYRQGAQANPRFSILYALQVLALALADRDDEAKTVSKRLFELEPNFRFGPFLAVGAAIMGSDYLNSWVNAIKKVSLPV